MKNTKELFTELYLQGFNGDLSLDTKKLVNANVSEDTAYSIIIQGLENATALLRGDYVEEPVF